MCFHSEFLNRLRQFLFVGVFQLKPPVKKNSTTSFFLHLVNKLVPIVPVPHCAVVKHDPSVLLPTGWN